jgi:hypothetical protein
MKFNALLEFLQNQMQSPSPPSPKRSQPADSDRKAKLDEQDRRDQARREKMASEPNQASSVDGAGGQEEEATKVGGAPDAVPAESVEDAHEVSGSEAQGGAADPAVPQEPGQGDEAAQTGRVGDEL